MPPWSSIAPAPKLTPSRVAAMFAIAVLQSVGGAVKHNWVGAATVLGDGDRSVEAAVCEVPVQAVANAVVTRRSATRRRIYSANAAGL
jgi:hypothetical protein